MSTPQLPRRRLLAGLGGLGMALLAAACGEGDPASPDGAAGEGAAEGDAGEILVFSNRSPHVTAIDIRTEEISRTGDLDDFTTWAWNDDNNFFDGRHLWLGTLDAAAGTAELITLDVDTLTHHQPRPAGQRGRGRLPRQGPPGRHPPRQQDGRR